MEKTEMNDIHETMETTNFPYKKFIIILAVIVFIAIWFIIFSKTSSQSKSIDSRLSELKQLRESKKAHEAIIEKEKNAIYELDKRIIPIKCWIFNDTGAKSSWEVDCRDHYESQKQEIQQQAVKTVEESLSNEIPE